MAFDGIVISGIVSELNNIISGGKIEKIHQPEKDELIFHIHNKKNKFKLNISCNSSSARITTTNDIIKNPATPYNFCMLLRKHIQGGRISSICQYDFDRIIEIPIETLDEMGFKVSKKLIIEIMGKHSNIILVNVDTGKIIDSIKRISFDISRERQLLSGLPYQYPPLQNKIKISEINENNINGIFDFSSLDTMQNQLLNTIQGFSPIIAKNISWEIQSKCDLNIRDRLLDTLYTIQSTIDKKSFIPRIYYKSDGSPFDFHIIPLNHLNHDYTYKDFSSISEAAEEFFSQKDSSNRLKQKSTDLKKSVKNTTDKLKLKCKRLAEDILEAKNSEIYKIKGELLIANLHNINNGSSQVTLNNYYTNLPITIVLDKRLTVSENAQKYFKRYSKSKTAVTEKTFQLESTKKEIEYLDSVSSFLEIADSIDIIDSIRNELAENKYIKKKISKGGYKIKQKKSSPSTFYTSDGFKFSVGKNNNENDYLTFKIASSKDLWFHTKDIPGSHVILFSNQKEFSKTSIQEASMAAAFYSKGRNSENVPVDYTLVKNVKKPKGAKPGMVIFTNNSTIYASPNIDNIREDNN